MKTVPLPFRKWCVVACSLAGLVCAPANGKAQQVPSPQTAVSSPVNEARRPSVRRQTAPTPALTPAPPTTAPAAGASAAFVAEGLGRATVAITGAWAFHPGDNMVWAAPAFDDSNWPRIETGRTWEEQGFRNLTGFGWYRRRIVLGTDANPDWRLAVMLPSVQDAAEVYWNGRLVGRYGKVPPNPVWYDSAWGPARFVVLTQLGRPQSGVLAIRVWKAPRIFFSALNEGGLIAPPVIGSAQALALTSSSEWYAWLRSSLYGLGLTLVETLVALLALLAWLRDRKEWMLFWLAVYTAHAVLLLPFSLPGLLSFRLSYGLIAPVVCAEDVSLWFLLVYLLGLDGNRPLVRWTLWMAAIAVASGFGDGALQLFHWTTWPGHVFLGWDIGLTIPSLLVEVWVLVLVAFALRRRLDGARWFLAISAALVDVMQAVSDWGGAGARWTHWTASNWSARPLFTVAGSAFTASRLADTLLLSAIVYAVWRYQAEQSRKQSLLDEEFRNAQELQQVLLPGSLPQVQGFHLSSAYRPALVVGGDFFQIVPVSGATLVVVGDVSGKGLKAAMTVALIVGALRSLAETISDPAKLLEGLNRRLHGRLEGGFATCLAMRLEANGECAAANAGHPAPLLNGEEVSLPGALPLGMVAEADYATTRIHMATGDRLTLYTDGLPEARSAEGELYGFERVQALVTAEADAEIVAAAAVEYGQEDDVTVVSVVREAEDGDDEFRLFQEMVSVTAGRRRGRESRE